MGRLRLYLLWYLTAALCTKTLLIASANLPEGAQLQNASLQPNARAQYFPKGTLDRFAPFYAAYLSSIGEPSLFAAARNTGAVSYRLICMDCGRPNLLVVRLNLNPDGSASVAIRSATLYLSGQPSATSKSQHEVTGAEVSHFSRLVEKASFWTMPTDEPENSNTHITLEKNDAGHWVFEGVRAGAYHVVFREGPEISPFTNMVRFLAKDLAQLDETAIPQASHSAKSSTSTPNL